MSTVESTLELLRERFPKCFVRYPQPRQPLKIGVHKDLAVVLAGVVSKSEIGRALTAYTNDVAYREALKPGAVRIDLNGEPAGVVTPGQIPPPRSKPKAKHASHSPAPPAPAPKRFHALAQPPSLWPRPPPPRPRARPEKVDCTSGRPGHACS